MEKGCLINGFTPNTLRFSLSIFVTKEDMDKAIGALDHALSFLDTLA
jgi:taurine--2-oxoglutarate transaminase